MFIIGASGAIGQQLIQACIERRGAFSCIAAINRTSLPEELAAQTICEFGFNVKNRESVQSALAKYKNDIFAVWNLAAPLSVDTAHDPLAAHDVTVKGMRTVCECMQELGLHRIYFSDSIGSFGKTAPRENATVSWLLANPEQDPGSEYGVQKRQCREIMREFAESFGFDTRFVVIPGVLHAQAQWGGGTTEYALDALLAAHRGRAYVCPIGRSVRLPMVYIDDLTRGMLDVSFAAKGSLHAEQSGYNLAAFSFSPDELFGEIKKHYPSAEFSFDSAANVHAAAFSETWPDSLSPSEALTDFGFEASFELTRTVALIITAHRLREG